MTIRDQLKKNITIKKPTAAHLFRPLKIFLIGTGAALGVLVVATEFFTVKYDSVSAENNASAIAILPSATHSSDVAPAVLDTVLYDKKMLELANLPPPPAPKPVATTTATGGTASTAGTTTVAQTPPAQAKPVAATISQWPTKAPYPLPGAILPYKRIIAYYGNFYSKGMGVLGKYPTEEMLTKLSAEVKAWEAADPTTPVIPAIDYIAVTAQGSPSVGGKYRLRMPFDQIDHAVELADRIHGIVILEIQPGQSTFEVEVPLLEKYLKMPQVHLALDPEFTMHGGAKPGSEIGSVDATTVNFVSNYLATLVKANNLPPKVLIVHRFTNPMVTHAKLIKPLPEVQIIMDMDGWGSPAKKIGTYNNVVIKDPVQFTGFKLFYKNDLFAPSTRMLSPTEILKLSPRPSFIQFQ